MQTHYITTTELRTKSKKLVNALKSGESVSLIHRSKVIGKIAPHKEETRTIKDIKAFEKLLDSMKPKKIIPRKERERRYRKHIMEKYGKGVS